MGLFEGKKGLILGVANDHSIASHLVTRYFSAAVLVEGREEAAGSALYRGNG